MFNFGFNSIEFQVQNINEEERDSNESQVRNNNEEEQDEDVAGLAGMRALIGASLHSTNSHVCSATMASYLLRNKSRFHFSHDFAYVNLTHFDTDDIQNYVMNSDNDGVPFMHSYVSDYIHRPEQLEDVCLYDFFSLYTVRKTKGNERNTSTKLAWRESHPTRNHLSVCKKKISFKIPIIHFMHFLDTKLFGGHSIDSSDLASCDDSHLYAMELYAKKVCLTFIPFRTVTQLKTNGKFLSTLRKFLLRPPDSFQDFHASVLKNMQDCKNSMNAGRPQDSLERVTKKPAKPNTGFEGYTADDENNQILSTLIEHPQSTFGKKFVNFRNKNGLFDIKSSIIRNCGSLNCGNSLLRTPNIDITSSVIITSPNSTDQKSRKKRKHNDIDCQTSSNPSNKYSLYTIVLCKTTRILEEGEVVDVLPTGNVQNIKDYAEFAFQQDEDQKQAFTLIVAAFLVKLYENVVNSGDGAGRGKRIITAQIVDPLKKLNGKNEQLIAFLSGAGGTGKSKVVQSVLSYCKRFCKSAGVEFNKRTIVVSAMTGAAAVGIFGETTHSACHLNNKKITTNHIEEWKDAVMLIVDEISFASEKDLANIHNKLNELKETPFKKYGDIPIIFAGDFTQLQPVGGFPIYLNHENDLWYKWVNTFLELKTNHRFTEDKEWGELLQNARTEGASADQLKIINSRVVCEANHITESDIPHDIVYAVKSNKDKAAINDGLFALSISKTHSKDPNVEPPLHTICIKASEIYFKIHTNTRDTEYTTKQNKEANDIMYASCGDGHVKDGRSKHYDLMLKLYKDRPMCINKNIDVENCIANGAMCKFKGVIFKDGKDETCLEKVIIDGYYVYCVQAQDLEAIQVEMKDGNHDKNNPKIVNLKAVGSTATALFPMAIEENITNMTSRNRRNIKFQQFPVNIADAITVHKLQGKTVHYILISTWDYTGNWIYVILSRCPTLKGIFIRKPLTSFRSMDPQCMLFHLIFRQKKSPNMSQYRN